MLGSADQAELINEDQMMTMANLGALAALISQRGEEVLSNWRKAARQLPSAF